MLWSMIYQLCRAPARRNWLVPCVFWWILHFVVIVSLFFLYHRWCIDVFVGLMLLRICLMRDIALKYFGDMWDLERGVIIHWGCTICMIPAITWRLSGKAWCQNCSPLNPCPNDTLKDSILVFNAKPFPSTDKRSWIHPRYTLNWFSGHFAPGSIHRIFPRNFNSFPPEMITLKQCHGSFTGFAICPLVRSFKHDFHRLEMVVKSAM